MRPSPFGRRLRMITARAAVAGVLFGSAAMFLICEFFRRI